MSKDWHFGASRAILIRIRQACCTWGLIVNPAQEVFDWAWNDLTTQGKMCDAPQPDFAPSACEIANFVYLTATKAGVAGYRSDQRVSARAAPNAASGAGGDKR